MSQALALDLQVGTKVKFKRGQELYHCDVVLEYLGPGYSKFTFKGRVVQCENKAAPFDIDEEDDTFSRDDWEVVNG